VDGETVNFHGEYLSVMNSTHHQIPDSLPLIYFGGSSPAGIALAAKHADVYLTWGEPPAAVAEKLDRVRKAATDVGRALKFGIRGIAAHADTEQWLETRSGDLPQSVGRRRRDSRRCPE
jgi:alkanesulfonate monooxygenase